MNRIDTAITNREIVKIGARAGHAQGLKGIALGYNANYDTVKVGFVNESGEYTGEYTKVGAAHIEFVAETEAVSAPASWVVESEGFRVGPNWYTEATGFSSERAAEAWLSDNAHKLDLRGRRVRISPDTE